MSNNQHLLWKRLFVPVAATIMLSTTWAPVAADMNFVVNNSLTWEMSFPADVSISAGNEIFVVDAGRNQISIHDFSNQYPASFAVASPTAVAVAADGSIYVGSTGDYSVAILNVSGQVTGYLGDGAGEFLLPRNITIDPSTGNVYVVDQLDHSIKVYTADGSYLSRIGDAPNLPQDLAIVGQELFVIDQPLIPDAYGGEIRGARIQVFSMDGTPGRSFGSHGTGSGQLIRPRGIVSDSEGILYVSDSFHGAVLCFDVNGTYLGAIVDAMDPMRAPMGLDIDNYGRLVVASPLSPDVRIFALSDLLNDCPGIVDPEPVDSDGDGIWNSCDNCSSVANIDQLDGNANGVGDACEQQELVSFLNGPHDRAHNVTCVDCHAHNLPAMGRSAVCTGCHDGLYPHVPVMIAHTAATECLNCHDPHFQEQFAHLSDDLFIVRGIITGVTVPSQGTSTIISYSPDFVKTGWTLGDPPNADWGAKTGVNRGLIFVVNRHRPADTFEIISATDTQIVLQGVMRQETVDWINLYLSFSDINPEFGIIYGQMLRDKVRLPGGGTRPVRFFDANDGFVDSKAIPEGVCQVCHAQTLYYLNNGGGQEHDGGNCSNCHSPTTGFPK